MHVTRKTVYVLQRAAHNNLGTVVPARYYAGRNGFTKHLPSAKLYATAAAARVDARFMHAHCIYVQVLPLVQVQHTPA